MLPNTQPTTKIARKLNSTAPSTPVSPMELKANLEAKRRPIPFDVENKTHRATYAHFLVNKRWPDGIRFIQEWPHTSAITTIETKLTQYALKKEIAAVEESNRALSKAAL